MQSDSSVLVAVMNSPRDLACAREQHWYRIPQKTAPKFFRQTSSLSIALSPSGMTPSACVGTRKCAATNY